MRTVESIQAALVEARRVAQLAHAEVGPPPAPPDAPPVAGAIDVVALAKTAILRGLLPIASRPGANFEVPLPAVAAGMIRALLVKHHRSRGTAYRLIGAGLVDALAKHVQPPTETVAEIAKAFAVRQARLDAAHRAAADRAAVADREVARLEAELETAEAEAAEREAAAAERAAETSRDREAAECERRARSERDAALACAAVGLGTPTTKRTRRSTND